MEGQLEEVQQMKKQYESILSRENQLIRKEEELKYLKNVIYEKVSEKEKDIS